MSRFLLILSMLLSIVVVVESVYIYHYPPTFLKSVIKTPPTPKPLLAYAFSNLQKTKIPTSNITLGSVVDDQTNYRSQIFYYSTPEKPNSTKMLKVSGLMNLPQTPGKYPVIVMFRGFVPDNIYKPGVGTEPVAQVLAQHGYITLAPDFLGYGQSASASAEAFENRFQTYTTALSMLSSLATLNTGLATDYSGTISADMTKIGIWGHSNGGHIALSTLAISGVTYPTVLWAPVSTSFPYDILAYTDESDDQGKSLRKILAQFETLYNTDDFSPTNFYSWIKAPMEIDQGTADEEVPYWWSDNLVQTLKKDKIDVTYNTYAGADHNMLPSGWSSAVTNDISFYNKQFSK
ncbi:MAG TPA: prolyl oligopeptidase family serine peptidase [Patescibacteria group bacterium]|nr:prolyl oligopeptidase family serine peptidase [Patescibacteria group bacterium]